MILAFTFFGGFATLAMELNENKAINKRTKIDLMQEILFIGLGLFFLNLPKNIEYPSQNKN
jgi:hypothetical protein